MFLLAITAPFMVPLAWATRLLVIVVDGGEGVGAGVGVAELACGVSVDEPPPPPQELINMTIRLTNIFFWSI